MWVIKLGGSLLTTEALLPWLEALADCNAVIAPGGGAFADTVRTMQQRWRFSEQAAHDMAILAMQQHGRMLADLSGLPVMSNCNRIGPFAGRATMWLPDPDELNQSDIPASWDVSADSLAAWLARRIDADHLLLVKAASLPHVDNNKRPPTASRKLVDLGLLDEAFPNFIRDARFKVWLCNASEHRHVPALLNDPADYLQPVV